MIQPQDDGVKVKVQTHKNRKKKKTKNELSLTIVKTVYKYIKLNEGTKITKEFVLLKLNTYI